MKFLLLVESVEGVKDFVLNAIKADGGSVCPPLTVGVSLGSFDKVTEIAKKSDYTRHR